MRIYNLEYEYEKGQEQCNSLIQEMMKDLNNNKIIFFENKTCVQQGEKKIELKTVI